MQIRYFYWIAYLGLLSDCAPKEASKQVFESPEAFKVGLGKVYESYSIVHAGLSTDNLVLSQNALSALHGRLHEIQIEGLDSSGKAFWDSGTTRIMTILHHPGLMGGGLPEVRNAVMDVTPLLLDWLERFGFRAQDPVFLYQCPKARDGQTVIWLQKGQVTLNPYLGDSLRTSGTLMREVRSLR